MAKIRISALTPKSEKALARAMSNEDLLLMIRIEEDIKKGSNTVEFFRDVEKQMIEKYGFKVK